MGWQKEVSGRESEGVSFHGKGVRCGNERSGREMENQNWHHDYEITFGELTALGGSIPHPKNRERMTALRGIVRGEKGAAAKPPMPSPIPLFTDKPVIQNATKCIEESAE